MSRNKSETRAGAENPTVGRHIRFPEVTRTSPQHQFSFSFMKSFKVAGNKFDQVCCGADFPC